MSLDTSNQYGVSLSADGQHVDILWLYNLVTAGGRLARTQALTLSCWLLAIAAPDTAALVAERSGDTVFGRILTSILNS